MHVGERITAGMRLLQMHDHPHYGQTRGKNRLSVKHTPSLGDPPLRESAYGNAGRRYIQQWDMVQMLLRLSLAIEAGEIRPLACMFNPPQLER